MIFTSLDRISDWLSNWFEIIAGTVLVFVMLLTGADIVGRFFGVPIPGTYEIVSFAGGLIIGLAVPVTSRAKGHVIMDILTERVSLRTRHILSFMTRLAGAALFLFMSYRLLLMGMDIRVSGEVTGVLHIPFYPVAYAMSGAFFVEALTLVAEIGKIGGSGNE
jgi:TRAP-type C4-dicarboxylate transport system permease small subunit